MLTPLYILQHALSLFCLLCWVLQIAEDLATYLVDSEQTNSALALGVCINRDCSVKSAGGYLVQVCV
jgi:hypothetical protein